MRRRWGWTIALAVIIAAGIASRVGHTGIRFFDKNLGDLLYAAMVYAILRLTFFGASRGAVAAGAMAAMVAIELFQLTGIAARMLESTQLAVRICARLMGASFSFGDLASYAVAIAICFAIDLSRRPG